MVIADVELLNTEFTEFTEFTEAKETIMISVNLNKLRNLK